MDKYTEQNLQTIVETAAGEIRAALNEANVAHVNFRVEVEGRVTGDLKIKYSILDYDSSSWVSSHSPSAVLYELLRRHGWHKTNTAKLLSYAPDAEEEPDLAALDDNIPF